MEVQNALCVIKDDTDDINKSGRLKHRGSSKHAASRGHSKSKTRENNMNAGESSSDLNTRAMSDKEKKASSGFGGAYPYLGAGTGEQANVPR